MSKNRADKCSRSVFAAMNVRRAAQNGESLTTIKSKAEAAVEAAEECELGGVRKRRRRKRS